MAVSQDPVPTEMCIRMYNDNNDPCSIATFLIKCKYYTFTEYTLKPAIHHHNVCRQYQPALLFNYQKIAYNC